MQEIVFAFGCLFVLGYVGAVLRNALSVIPDDDFYGWVFLYLLLLIGVTVGVVTLLQDTRMVIVYTSAIGLMAIGSVIVTVIMDGVYSKKPKSEPHPCGVGAAEVGSTERRTSPTPTISSSSSEETEPEESRCTDEYPEDISTISSSSSGEREPEEPRIMDDGYPEGYPNPHTWK